MLKAHIVKARPSFTVDVRLELGRGECLALFGASGAGKSTVLSCLAGFENPDGGEIMIDDRRLYPPPLPLYQRPLAYLTQSDALFPHLSVAGNVCFGLDNGSIHNGAGKWIHELKQRLGLETVWDKPATQVSGGQARRVALARMLARRPPVVLIDEPFTALDRPTIIDLTGALREWQQRIGFALIAVDHRSEILEKLCPRVAVIETGKIVQEGSWAKLAAVPATPLTANLLGAR
jgi:ABC-type Fe3+/spermidine/putrescine transport system ATPase subunit